MSGLQSQEFWKSVGTSLFTEEQWARAPTEIEQVIDLLGIETGARVLDMPCGVGRHTLELARRGLKVTGVDWTREYLIEARERASEQRVDAEFVRGDMREFNRPAHFDVALNLYTSFGYFDTRDEDISVLRNLHASLKPEGLLCMEMASKEVLARIFQPRRWFERDDGYVLEEATPIDGWSRIRTKWIIIGGGEERVEEYNLRIYSAVEISDALRSAGFSSVDVYGGFDGSPYDLEAMRLVVVATK